MDLIGGFVTSEWITIAVLAVILLGILALLRVAFKLTATALKLGCAVVLLIVAGAAVYLFMM